ncbi:hypothetical protein CTI12_AA283210 [Artemisia annua]|uniref:Uncharacterized protein n=1 Tax=Artemisia annua TaxID=35608 RepID=A0A2U1NCH0_ARTAN|nr:hypothetical protein CTI12_AA283210 [Artemisia annua]
MCTCAAASKPQISQQTLMNDQQRKKLMKFLCTEKDVAGSSITRFQLTTLGSIVVRSRKNSELKLVEDLSKTGQSIFNDGDKKGSMAALPSI